MCGLAKEHLKVGAWVISSNIHQLQQQQNPLLALKVNYLICKFMLCAKFVERIHKIQALRKEDVGLLV